ncbi:MAG: putative spermidine/putrescine transport system permease protein [Paraglaciecola sp.]|jgi:putative spermidine/putrescine transport system permease protein
MRKGYRYIAWVAAITPVIALLYLTVVAQWTYPQLLLPNFTLSHWGALFTSGQLMSSLLLSFGIASFLAVIGTGFGFWVTWQLLHLSDHRGMISLAFYPYLIAPVVLGAMLNYYFLRWGLTGTIGGVMIAQSLTILPFSALLMSTFWSARIQSLSFQASTLGASPKQVLQNVLLPMAKPWLTLSLVQCFLISWFEFGITRLVGVGKVETLTVSSMLFIKEANPHQAAVAATLMIIPLLLLFLFNYRLIQRKLAG